MFAPSWAVPQRRGFVFGLLRSVGVGSSAAQNAENISLHFPRSNDAYLHTPCKLRPGSGGNLVDHSGTSLGITTPSTISSKLGGSVSRIGFILMATTLWATSAAGQSSSGTLAALGFMAGCWTGSAGGSTIIEEIYTRPSANIMLGTTRYISDKTTTMFEFSLISEDPQHDFPKRIIYRVTSDDQLLARIDGGEGSEQVMEWGLTKTDCPGS